MVKKYGKKKLNRQCETTSQTTYTENLVIIRQMTLLITLHPVLVAQKMVEEVKSSYINSHIINHNATHVCSYPIYIYIYINTKRN